MKRPELDTTFEPPRPFDLGLTLARWRMGSYDPSARLENRVAWTATRTLGGPATLRVDHSEPLGPVRVRVWGPGADWVAPRLPRLLGADDDPEAFQPDHRLVRRLHRDHRGFRLMVAPSVLEVLVRVILQQRVTFGDAARSYAHLCREFGDPAPGPSDLLLPPDPEKLARLPYHALRPADIDKQRADAIRTVCRADLAGGKHRVERLLTVDSRVAQTWLQRLPGIGPWTAGMLAGVALGDPDAVIRGDLHLPHFVTWVLGREPRGSDERMIELLEPFRGQRYRVVRLLYRSGIKAPRM